MDFFYTSLDVNQTQNRVDLGILNSGRSVERVATHGRTEPHVCVWMLVYQKYFLRNDSYASLSVLVENVEGRTRVTSISSGAGKGALNIDFGAVTEFELVPREVMVDYILPS